MRSRKTTVFAVVKLFAVGKCGGGGCGDSLHSLELITLEGCCLVCNIDMRVVKNMEVSALLRSLADTILPWRVRRSSSSGSSSKKE